MFRSGAESPMSGCTVTTWADDHKTYSRRDYGRLFGLVEN